MSTSGSTLYRKISETRSSLESELSRRTQANLGLSRRSQTLLEQQAALWASLAEIHLDLGLDLPREIKKLVDRRKDRLEDQKNLVEASAGRIAKLTEAHRERETAMTAAQKAFDDHERELAAKLNADPDAVRLTSSVNGLKSLVGSISQKVDRIESECDEKRKAYAADELFCYLYGRRFGTDEYQRSGLVARLDHWVARLVGYERAAADYDQLEKIPQWHAENLARLKGELAASSKKLDALHDETFKTLVPLKLALREAGKALDAAAEDLSREHAAVKAAQRLLADAASAQDEDLKAIKSAFAQALGRASVSDLEALAARTATTEDDEIVRKIAANRAELAKLERESDDIAREILSLKTRISDIEDVESKLRRKNWHHSDHSFGLKGDVDSYLAGLVSGMLTSDSLWMSLETSHRAPTPSYRETVSTSGSPWPSSSGSSSWSSSSDDDRRSSSSSSDYSTGGGWGGGSDSGSSSSGSDYSTGGGF